MKRLRSFVRSTLIATLVLALLSVIAVGWLGSSHLISPPRRAVQDYHGRILATPAEFGLTIQKWTGPRDTPCLVVSPSKTPGAAQKSREARTRLHGAPRWGKVQGTVVLLHGHSGRKEDHLPICERFCAAGFRCLIPDLPGHGDHPESIARFGFDEASLVEELIERCSSDFGFSSQPVFLFGVSQGGAIALQTAARDPERWAGVISVAAFASLDQPLRSATRRLRSTLLSTVIVESVSWTTRARAGFFPEVIRPVDAAMGLTLPTMVIHGEDDTFVELRQGREIFEAIPSTNKQFLAVPKAGHGRVLAADADRTYASCCQFMLDASLRQAPLQTAR